MTTASNDKTGAPAPTMREIRIALAITIVLSILTLVELALPAYEKGRLLTSRRLLVIAGPGIVLVGLQIALLAITWTPLAEKLSTALGSLVQWLSRLGRWNLALFGLILALYGALVFGPWGWLVRGLATRSLLLWIASLAGCVLLKAWRLSWQAKSSYETPERSSGPSGTAGFSTWGEWLGVALLAAVFAYKIASFLPDISSYPFTLGWSETSRYYYASLFFSERIYGFSLPPTVLHPSRYLMQAVPFLVSGTPLWLHRAWQVLLWMALPLLTSLALVRRLRVPSRLWRWLALMWSFLYLLLGPVYYHLLVPVIILLLGFQPLSFQPLGFQRSGYLDKAAGKDGEADRRSYGLRLVLSLAALLLASAWAGISRINWFPAPGLLAAVLILLEQSVERPALSENSNGAGHPQVSLPWSWRAGLRYSLAPVLWVVLGTLTAFASQALYILWSNNPAESFTSSFSSGLLWYRLLPNPTFAPGILGGVLLVSLPLILLAASALLPRAAWKRVHPLRWLGLSAALLVLFAGGLLVSVKIGGGSNLHNMDAFLVFLLVIASALFFQHIALDRPLLTAGEAAQPSRAGTSRRLARAGLLAGLLIVGWFTITAKAPPLPLPERQEIEKGLYNLRRFTQEASQQGGEVLFLSNRHLLTFGELQDVRLVPEYERVFLMEMAMAENEAYLEAFHNDLKNQRFALIVSEPLYDQHKDENAIFGEENNAWVTQVSQVVLCYYEEIKLARYVHMQLLVPKAAPGECNP